MPLCDIDLGWQTWTGALPTNFAPKLGGESLKMCDSRTARDLELASAARNGALMRWQTPIRLVRLLGASKSAVGITGMQLVAGPAIGALSRCCWILRQSTWRMAGDDPGLPVRDTHSQPRREAILLGEETAVRALGLGPRYHVVLNSNARSSKLHDRADGQRPKAVFTLRLDWSFPGLDYWGMKSLDCTLGSADKRPFCDVASVTAPYRPLDGRLVVRASTVATAFRLRGCFFLWHPFPEYDSPQSHFRFGSPLLENPCRDQCEAC